MKLAKYLIRERFSFNLCIYSCERISRISVTLRKSMSRQKSSVSRRSLLKGGAGIGVGTLVGWVGSSTLAPTLASNSKFKNLRGIGGLRDGGAIKHKVNQGLPPLKAEILSEADDILEKPFARPPLFANLLVSQVG